jgi:hypothetical protein
MQRGRNEGLAGRDQRRPWVDPVTKLQMAEMHRMLVSFRQRNPIGANCFGDRTRQSST